jgi:(p)ppGpp synthase/HD superfamily hydrolase
MHGYSDRIHHAFAFAAKHYGVTPPVGEGTAYLAHPSNLAVILTRYGADQITVVAGILHLVLEEASPDRRLVLEHKIADKFGSVALAIAKGAMEPRYDDRGERPWRMCKIDYLSRLALAEPRALDICVADEIHNCGATSVALRRLGVEYLRAVTRAGSDQTIWWYRSLVEVLERRPEWPNREMLAEMRQMSVDLVHQLRKNEEEL